MNEGMPAKSTRPKWWSRPRPVPPGETEGASTTPTTPEAETPGSPEGRDATPGSAGAAGPGGDRGDRDGDFELERPGAVLSGRGGEGDFQLGQPGEAPGGSEADTAPSPSGRESVASGAGEPGDAASGPALPPAERPKPLHDPDPYNTPPYGEPGPWAPAPPVQHPAVAPAHGTAVPTPAAAPGAPALSSQAPSVPAPRATPHGAPIPTSPVPQGVPAPAVIQAPPSAPGASVLAAPEVQGVPAPAVTQAPPSAPGASVLAAPEVQGVSAPAVTQAPPSAPGASVLAAPEVQGVPAPAVTQAPPSAPGASVLAAPEVQGVSASAVIQAPPSAPGASVLAAPEVQGVSASAVTQAPPSAPGAPVLAAPEVQGISAPAASAPPAGPAPADSPPHGHAAPSADTPPATDPWHRYDPWAATSIPAPLQQSGVGVPTPEQRRRRVRRALVGGAVVLALASGGLGGLVGAYIERNGGVGAVELPQAGKEPTGRAPDSVAGIAARALPSVVTLHVTGSGEQGTGTGFVLDRLGHILTNNHVVEPAASSGDISVTFSGGQTAKARIVGRDTGYDLAVVQVRGVRGLTPIPLGNSDNVQVGDPVVAIGTPFDLANTVTSGIISAKERPITAGGEKGDGSDLSYVDALQTDAAINPGNSGGPLLDSRARVVGINSAIRSADSGSDLQGAQAGSIGLGFAIPINQAKRVAEELINTGKATHPVIGVTLDMNYTGDGARVGTKGRNGKSPVTPGGPGAKAGIKAGDVITVVDGRRVHSGEELIVKTRAHRPGDRLELTIERDGKERTVSLVLGSSNSN
ncbi:trypsin-like peptidase domain-containing protein [Streptomyces sp. NPDC005202]|uniref:S1C family serine protease n=1 Tax=Streptomyces sp. NPDC005202 TaxID=3157021 RepID=UPI0033A98E6C